MRYKLLIGAFVLLIATPVLAQKFSPIVIETGKPTPGAVKSGEPFKVTYRAKFFDTVLIYEDQMKPDNLALDKIEAIGLDVIKERVSNDILGFVNIWDFTYTFRIIQPEKKVYKVPSFNFIWVEKKAGVTAEEAKEKEKPREMPTEEVGVNYFSSIVKPPPLDIRDEINFVSPIADGVVWRRWAYGVIGTALFLVMIVVFRFVQYPKARQSQEAGQEAVEIAEGDVVINMEPILSPKQARRKFLRELKKLRGKSALALTKEIRFLVRALLSAELRQGFTRVSMADTPNEIYAKLTILDYKQAKQIGWIYPIFVDLARRLKGYQENIDSGMCFLNISREVAELRVMVSGLKLHKRIWSFAKRLVKEGR